MHFHLKGHFSHCSLCNSYIVSYDFVAVEVFGKPFYCKVEYIKNGEKFLLVLKINQQQPKNKHNYTKQNIKRKYNEKTIFYKEVK